MPQAQTPTALPDPAELAKSLGGTVTPATTAKPTTPGTPSTLTQQPGGPPHDPAMLAKSLGGTVTPAAAAKPAAPTSTPSPTLTGPLGSAMTAGGKAHAAATGAVIDIARGFDPRTTEGRQNLIAGAGGAAGALATGGLGAVPWIARILGAPAGAAAGGMIAEAGEQIAGNKPPSEGAVAGAGLTQGAYELGGKVLMWPVRRLLTTFKAAPAVARQAKEAVESGVRTARTVAREGVDDAIEKGRRFLTGEKVAARQGVRQVQQQAALDLGAAEMKSAREIADASAIYDQLVATSTPSILGAGKAVKAVVNPRETPALPRGAAQRALDALGAKVGEAAETGPQINVTPVKLALNEMAQAARPDAIFAQGAKAPDAGKIGFLQTIASKLRSRAPEAAGIQPGKPGAVLHGDLRAIESEIAKELGVAETHPLPGIIGKIATLPDGATLSFADAHQLKKLLDESVNFDRVASKHVEQITKGVRNVLREQLAVHAPYNAATKAFQEAVPLYRKGVGRQLIKAALEDPDKVVTVLKVDQPARAQAVKDLILTKSAEGGDPAAGQQAWQALQAAWVHDKIISGGPENLSKRLATVLTESPEFAKIVLGDATAQRMLSNIDRIGQAYRLAEQQAGERILNQKAAGAQAVTAAKDVAGVRVERAATAASDARRVAARAGAAGVDAAQQRGRDFRKSRLAAHERPLDESFTGLDVIRAGASPGSVGGNLAILRLLSKAPRRDELIEWAAYSDQNTQRLVRALNSQLPATAVADLLREMTGIVAPVQSADPKSGKLPAQR